MVQENKEKLVQDLKLKLSATVGTDSEGGNQGCSLGLVLQRFELDWCKSLPSYCDELGYPCVISLFKTLPDVVKIKGSPYEPEKIEIFPVTGENLEHQIGIIKETDAKREHPNVVWKGKGLPPKRLFRANDGPTPEEVRLKAGFPIRYVYPCSSGLRHRHLLEVLFYKEKLANNPTNSEIKFQLTEAKKKLIYLNDKDSTFGDFEYCVPVKVLTDKELEPDDPQFFSWSSRVRFCILRPCYGGPGLVYMRKTGWKIGKGLGKKEDGMIEPYIAHFKFNNKGLATFEDHHVIPVCVNPTVPPICECKPKLKPIRGQITLEGKNAIAVLYEYCSKKRLANPSFEFKSAFDDEKKLSGFICKAFFQKTNYLTPNIIKSKKESKNELCLKILKEALNFSDREIEQLKKYETDKELTKQQIENIEEKQNINGTKNIAVEEETPNLYCDQQNIPSPKIDIKEEEP